MHCQLPLGGIACQPGHRRQHRPHPRARAWRRAGRFAKLATTKTRTRMKTMTKTTGGGLPWSREWAVASGAALCGGGEAASRAHWDAGQTVFDKPRRASTQQPSLSVTPAQHNGRQRARCDHAVKALRGRVPALRRPARPRERPGTRNGRLRRTSRSTGPSSTSPKTGAASSERRSGEQSGAAGSRLAARSGARECIRVWQPRQSAEPGGALHRGELGPSHACEGPMLNAWGRCGTNA